jgi:chorismate synthase
MRNTFGNKLTVTIFGESHGEAIGALLDGVPAGICVDEDFIKSQLTLRRPSGDISTPRAEKDEFSLKSGVFEGKTTGAPICIVIKNRDTKSKDYSEIKDVARPSHADFTAFVKYGGFNDYRGGGHFSGRLTAALVAAGALVIPYLKEKGIFIGTHIKSIGGISDRDFGDITADVKKLSSMDFAVLDGEKKEKMINRIREVRSEGDSIGGVLETAVIGLPAGLGDPFFDSCESMLSHALFSIPAVKGVEFGAGFKISEMTGSAANDEFFVENGTVFTKTNNSGGINGGITNGQPLIVRCAVRPTPTIAKEQHTVNFKTNENTVLKGKGRHDPCIVHRARVVADSVVALVIADMIS